MNWSLNRSAPRSDLVRFGGAFVFVTCALLITLLIWPLIQPMSSPLFLAAIMLSAWWGGFRPGVLASFTAAVTLNFVFINPQYQFAVSVDDISRLTFFMAEGIVLSWLIDTRMTAAEEIENSREQLRALSLHQQTLREAEQKRIALEIHDELGQALTGIKMDVFWLKRQINAAGGDASQNSLSEKLSELLKLIDSTISSVRRIATELRPPILDDFGLIAAIEWQTREFEKKTGISCFLKSEVEDPDLDPESATAVFRIFQETLTNVARHAGASAVQVDFESTDAKIVMRVEDNGKGIDLNRMQYSYSLGILGMQERARLIGGRLNITRGRRRGTIVELIIQRSEAPSGNDFINENND